MAAKKTSKELLHSVPVEEVRTEKGKNAFAEKMADFAIDEIKKQRKANGLPPLKP